MKKFMKNKTLWLLTFSIIGIGVGYWLGHSYEFGLCYSNFETNTFDVSCHQLSEKIGNALFYTTQALAFVFLILLFVPHAFNAWEKFAIWFIPFMFIYFALYENKGFFSVPEESVYRFFSIIYFGASLGIIIVSFVSERMVRTGRPSLHTLWYWFGALLSAIVAFHASNFLGFPIF